jgi:hypothetical protein
MQQRQEVFNQRVPIINAVDFSCVSYAQSLTLSLLSLSFEFKVFDCSHDVFGCQHYTVFLYRSAVDCVFSQRQSYLL